MTERDTDLRGGDGESGGDGEDRYGQSEEDTEHIDPDSQPTGIHECQPIRPRAERLVHRAPYGRVPNKPVLNVDPILVLLLESASFTVRPDGG